MTSVSRIIDHTLLAPDATAEQIDALCQEAKDLHMGAVCVNPSRVPQCREALAGSDVTICTVIGFPLGATLSEAKAAETRAAVAAGAGEVDMVLNIGAAKDGDWDAVEADIRAVVEASGQALTKVILETCLLTDDEIRRACAAAKSAGADFVKTSTGFSTGGATVHAVALMRECVGQDMGVKASGGIRTAKDLAAMVAAGATRIGASAGKALLDAEPGAER